MGSVASGFSLYLAVVCILLWKAEGWTVSKSYSFYGRDVLRLDSFLDESTTVDSILSSACRIYPLRLGYKMRCVGRGLGR